VALDDCLAHEEVARLRDRLAAENTYLQEEIRSEHNFTEVVGNSPALRAVLRSIEQVAPTDATALILGETGTGKELVARAIHDRSPRRDRPLVKVNCAAISAGLVESELFGHVRGAFTGALDHRDGRFKIADGGTIFLDEVGELPLETQVKLLRILQEQEFEPVGSSKTLKVNVRVIAATNRDLAAEVQGGKFRSDLFYRLNVFPIRVPPLRDRVADIGPLVMYFVQQFAKKFGKPVPQVADDALRRLRAYSWPGNVRELQNVIERAVVLAAGPVLTLDDGVLSAVAPTSAPASNGAEAPAAPAGASLEEVERQHILAVLGETRWRIEGERGAAKVLGLSPSTLRSRMQRLGISRTNA
jgi:formate hydrogenlyase transcriptional activator